MWWPLSFDGRWWGSSVHYNVYRGDLNTEALSLIVSLALDCGCIQFVETVDLLFLLSLSVQLPCSLFRGSREHGLHRHLRWILALNQCWAQWQAQVFLFLAGEGFSVAVIPMSINKYNILSTGLSLKLRLTCYNNRTTCWVSSWLIKSHPRCRQQSATNCILPTCFVQSIHATSSTFVQCGTGINLYTHGVYIWLFRDGSTITRELQEGYQGCCEAQSSTSSSKAKDLSSPTIRTPQSISFNHRTPIHVHPLQSLLPRSSSSISFSRSTSRWFPSAHPPSCSSCNFQANHRIISSHFSPPHFPSIQASSNLQETFIH